MPARPYYATRTSEAAEPGREERWRVDFPIFLSWQSKDGMHRIRARCVDLSPSGAKLETRDRVETRADVLVESEKFGRMGMASIRHCLRSGMKYNVGLQFSTPFLLSDPIRKGILEKALRRDPSAADL